MLAWDEAGKRRHSTLVLLHGWPLDRTIWSDALPVLARAGFRAVAPDLPGFGGSPPLPERNASVEQYAVALAAFLRKVAPGPVALVGHSFGGYVALAFAERHPRIVQGLALVSSRAIPDSEAARRGREETISKVLAQGTSALLPGLAERLLGPAADPSRRRAAHRLIEKAAPEGVVAGLRAMASRPGRSAVLEGLRGPLLVLHGDADALIPISEVAKPSSPRGAVTVTILSGVGHMPMWEASEATIGAVVAWAKASFGRP